MNVDTLPRNPAYSELAVRTSCGRIQLFVARNDWRKASQSLKQLIDQLETSANQAWFAWAFEACALSLVGRIESAQSLQLLEWSKRCLSNAGAAPTPRQQRNWDRVECASLESTVRHVPFDSGHVVAAEPFAETFAEPFSTTRAVWLLGHEVLDSMQSQKNDRNLRRGQQLFD